MSPTLVTWLIFVALCVLTLVLLVACFRSQRSNLVAWLISFVVSVAALGFFSHITFNFKAVADWMDSEDPGQKYSGDTRQITRYLEWKGDAVHMRDDPAALRPPLGWAIYVGNYNTGRGARPVEIGQPFPVDPGDSEVFYRFRQDPEYHDGVRRNPTSYRSFTR